MPLGDTWTNTYTNAEGASSGCLGFARMVLDATYGKGTSISASPATGTYSTSDTAAIKTAFGSINVGDRVTFQMRGKTGADEQHAVIVTAKDTNEISVYDCNADNKFTIQAYSLSYTNMLKKYDKIRGGAHHK